MNDKPAAPASEADLAACEAAVGAVIPHELRQRLAGENGWRVDDSRGATGEEWRFLPVLDRSDRKSRVRTAEDIAWHTARLRQARPDFAEAVVVARAWDEQDRLIVLPGDDRLHRQRGSGDAVPIDADALGVRPTPPAGARPRTRDELPRFRYHPDPVATGAIVEDSAAVCPGCGEARGWAYATTPYGYDRHPDICPWCIADGTAAQKLGAQFIDVYWVDDEDLEPGQTGIPRPAPLEMLDELASRTPGFASFQQEEWQYCHDEPCAFTGRARADELEQLPPAGFVDADYIAELRAIEASGSDEMLYAVAWAFRCLHCDSLHVWMDVP